MKGTPSAGSYIRTRSADNALREDVAIGDYSMSRIQEQGKVATRGQWVDVPYPVCKVMEFVPYLPIRFDASDVINEISEAEVNGKVAVCIHFVTV